MKVRVPQWIATALLVVLAPVIGFIVFSDVEGMRTGQSAVQTDDANLIAYMHQQYDAQYPRRGYHWTIQRRNGEHRLVCYCDANGYGWWYDVEALSGETFTANPVADTHSGSQSASPSMLTP